MKLGIMGGAFNPIHHGHLLLAQEAYEEYDLDLVAFIPASDPPHKRIRLPFADRHLMCLNAIAPDERFALLDIEDQIRSGGYTIKTLEALADDPEWSKWEFYLILGGDQAGAFFTWHEPCQILQLANIICAERFLHDRARIIDHWGEQSYRLYWLDMPPVDLSSSLIRDRIRSGRSIRYMVPRPIEDYILAEGLYR